MGKKTKLESTRDYEMIISRLKECIRNRDEIPPEENIPSEKIEEEIRKLILDLDNYYSEEWERKSLVAIDGAPTDKVKKFRDYLSKKLKIRSKRTKKEADKKQKEQAQQQEEEIWRQIEETINNAAEDGKQGTKREIIEGLIESIKNGKYNFGSKEKKKKVLKKLNGMIEEINKKEAAEAAEREARRRQEEEKRKAEEAAAEEKRKQEVARKNAEAEMNQIQERAEREYKLGMVESRLEALNKIRDTITGEGIDLGEEMGELSQEHLLEILDGKIKDELYYEQVKAHTNNFEFLRDYPELVKADHGARERKKFTDYETYSGFENLVEELQRISNDEGVAIQQMLENKNISEIDRRILTERREVLEKQIAIKRQQEGLAR